LNIELCGYAYFPSALSSIFSPKLKLGAMNDKIRLDTIGARGGGFSLVKGSETWVRIHPDGSDRIEVVVNEKIKDFPPSIEAAKEMRRRYNITGKIEIRHRIDVPIGSGFGTSASSAAGVILAISTMLGKGATLTEVIRTTHEIELRCRTGLNSEVGLMTGGLVLVLREGAPPRSIVDSIPLSSEVKLVAIVSGPIETPDSLSELSRLEEVEKLGDKYLSTILKHPTAENFLRYAREFSYESGFVTRKVQEIFDVIRNLPVIGYAQNMLGEAVHALVREKHLDFVVRSLSEHFPDMQLIVSDITSIYNVYSKSIDSIELEQLHWR